MNIIRNISSWLLLAALAVMAGCSEDYLETTPSDSVGDATVASSLDNCYLALNGIHRKMVSQDSGYQCIGGLPGIMFCMDAEGDDMTWKTNTWLKAAYLGWSCNMNESSGYNYTMWKLFYGWIFNANKILEILDGMGEPAGAADKALYEQIKGECLCIRAWAHFNLVQIYGDRYDASSSNSQDGVPYRTASTGGEQARNSVAEVYDLINTDLAAACTVLEGNTALESQSSCQSENHYTAKVAYGLRARVALAMQDYSNAATYAAKSISLAEADGNALMTGDQLYCGFSKITEDTDEAMYAAMTKDDQTVYFYSFYAYMSWNFSSSAVRQGVKCINAETYGAMSETDLRREWFDPTGEASVPTSAYARNIYQNRKFTAQSTSSAVGDVAFMRLAEMYLIEAEALARAGRSSEAQEVFTKFQVTRDPSYVSQGNTGDDLAEEIMASRRVELWGEGFRFFDLKRLHQPIVRGSNFIVSFCTFLEKDADAQGWTWEIPKKETDYNPLCTKNYK